jgi:hypothetical protein
MFAIRRHALMTEQNHQPGLLVQTVTFNRIQVVTRMLSSGRIFSAMCHAGTLEGLEDVGNEYSIVSEVVDRALAATKDVSQGLT